MSVMSDRDVAAALASGRVRVEPYANVPIPLYLGVTIGQVSFFQMSSPADRPCGSSGLGSKYQGQSEPMASARFEDFGLGRNTSGAMPSRSAAQGVRTRPATEEGPAL